MRRRHNKQVLQFLILLLTAAVSLNSVWAQTTRPNIVLVIADDLGFSDIAPYGSEIQTPTSLHWQKMASASLITTQPPAVRPRARCC
jgi:hypothetical protein